MVSVFDLPHDFLWRLLDTHGSEESVLLCVWVALTWMRDEGQRPQGIELHDAALETRRGMLEARKCLGPTLDRITSCAGSGWHRLRNDPPKPDTRVEWDNEVCRLIEAADGTWLQKFSRERNRNLRGLGLGVPLMSVAAIHGLVRSVKALIKRGMPVDGLTHPQGYTPLILVCIDPIQTPHTAAVEMLTVLLAAGANRDHRGLRWLGLAQTALMKAARYGHTELVKVLVASGATVNLQDRHGDTALDMATKNKHTEIMALLSALPH
jgi:hypothetical protein